MLLSGCAALDDAADRAQAESLASWVGHTGAEVKQVWGEPHVVTKDPAGGETWTFIQSQNFSTGQAARPTSTSFTLSAEGRVVSWRRA